MNAIRSIVTIIKTALVVTVFTVILALPSIWYLSNPFMKTETKGYILKRTSLFSYHVYLKEAITDTKEYSDLSSGLRALAKYNTVTFHVAAYGGYISSGLQLLEAIKASKAHTITRVEGPTYSMNSILTCATDQYSMTNSSFLMFHSWQKRVTRKRDKPKSPSEISKEILMSSNMDRVMYNIMVQECVPKGILTVESIKQIVYNRADVYVSPADKR